MYVHYIVEFMFKNIYLDFKTSKLAANLFIKQKQYKYQ